VTDFERESVERDFVFESVMRHKARKFSKLAEKIVIEEENEGKLTRQRERGRESCLFVCVCKCECL